MKSSSPCVARSITKTTAVIKTVATSTIIVDCCNSTQVGQVTFSINSLYDSLIYTPILFIQLIGTGTRIRTQIKGFGDLYSTIELCPCFMFSRTKYPSNNDGYFVYLVEILSISTFILLKDLCNLSSTYCSTTLTDSET